jgi:hypothetical protein
MNVLPTMSEKSKKYFALSSRYFDTKFEGAVQLIGELKSFDGPEVQGGFDLSIQSPSFSFSVWLRLSPQFVRGYIIRKKPMATSELVCWAWYVDATYGPQIHLGAHDFFATEAVIGEKPRQSIVMLEESDGYVSLLQW